MKIVAIYSYSDEYVLLMLDNGDTCPIERNSGLVDAWLKKEGNKIEDRKI